MYLTKSIGRYWIFQLSGQGQLINFEKFKWKQGFNVQFLGVSFSLYFLRGKYKNHKAIII